MELREKHSNFGYFIKNDFYCDNQSFRDCSEAPFKWKLLLIGTISAKGIWKYCQFIDVNFFFTLNKKMKLTLIVCNNIFNFSKFEYMTTFTKFCHKNHPLIFQITIWWHLYLFCRCRGMINMEVMANISMSTIMIILRII